jgi:FkbM family methyltransferase
MKLFKNKKKISLGHASFSQAGEDAVARFLFTDKKINKIKYLDLGTSGPDHCNNTYWFYLDGSRGVCVEADITFIEEIKKKRPGDIVLNYGVAVADQKEADFYIFNIPGLNTFDRVEAKKRESFGNVRIDRVVKVPLISINTLIAENFENYPDFLSMDIEGLDLAVLRSLDYKKYPIPVICVETCTYSENHIRPKDRSIAEFVCARGYEIYADTYVNTIFVNREWFYKI